MTRCGIDTNVILRLIIDDDADQRRRALAFSVEMARSFQGYLTLISLVELDWALRSRYGYARARVADTIRMLLRVRGLEVKAHNLVLTALKVMGGKADFADVLIALKPLDAGCDRMVTFDQTAARLIPGMDLLA